MDHPPYKLCDLPLGARLTFTIYDVASSNASRVIGGTTLPLFSKKGTLKSAQHRLFVWKGVKADGKRRDGYTEQSGRDEG